MAHIVSDFTLYAPSEQPFLLTGATGFYLEGSNDGSTWTVLYSGTTAGTVADQGVCFNYFGGAQTVTGGTFTIVWHANGLFRFTV